MVLPPPPEIAPLPPAASGVVLSGAWMATAQGQAFCEALGEALGSEAVRCLSFASILFSGSLYQALAYGESVQTAFDLGCSQIHLMGLSEANVPRLLCREGVSASSVRLL